MENSGDEAEQPMPIRLTLRDLEILETLYTARYLTTFQIQALFWKPVRGGKHGPKKTCERRMRLLYQAGLVRRIEMPVKRGEGPKPFIYALDRKGAELLVTELGVDPATLEWRPRPQEENYPFLEHLLTTTDFRIALQDACIHCDVELLMWRDEKELRSEGMFDRVTIANPSGKEQTTAVIPDAVFMLSKEGKRGLFFVEIDMRSVTVQPTRWERKGWVKKIQAYNAYVRSETYAARYENRLARVLIITTGERRLENIKKAAEMANGDTKFWFTTFERALDADELLKGPIWTVVGSDTLRALIQ